MPTSKPEWVSLGYSVPAVPSKARVFVWRRLKALGAQAFRPGMAVLPNTRENIARFEALAERIRQFSGEAQLIEFNFVSAQENLRMRERFSAADIEERRALVAQCSSLLESLSTACDPRERAALERTLKRTLESGRRRQSGPEEEFERALAELFGTLRAIPAEFSAMLRGEKP